MNNGSNDWGVSYSRVAWFLRLLTTHSNVANVERHDDIVFEVDREKQGDHLRVLCCYEYTMGVTSVQRGLAEFGALHIIHIGGGWCGYTKEAKQFCLSEKIGLYVTNEMSGALWSNEYWAYHKKDKDGDPEYFFREE